MFFLPAIPHDFSPKIHNHQIFCNKFLQIIIFIYKEVSFLLVNTLQFAENIAADYKFPDSYCKNITKDYKKNSRY